jgi:tRNA (guanine-N7-)-methyltransferase
MAEEEPKPAGGHRTIRSFVVRAGRMTAGQQRAMDELWPVYGLGLDPQPLDPDALFGRQAPRVLEIGFGNGENLAALADRRHDSDFIGIEVHPPGVGQLLQQIAARGLTNVRIFCHDAVEVLAERLPEACLDEVLILFPDPWHKKRHHKRRIIQPQFLNLLASRLKIGGVLRLATDWVPYAEHMLEQLTANASFRNLSPSGDYVARYEDRLLTRFERRGQRLGHEVRDLAFVRVACSQQGALTPGPSR